MAMLPREDSSSDRADDISHSSTAAAVE
jgi:hypothetical protein